MRIFLFLLFFFTGYWSPAQRINAGDFRFTLTDSGFDSGKSRITYTWKYKKAKHQLTISKPAGKLYTITATTNNIKEMSVDEQGRIVILWQTLKEKMEFGFDVEKHQPWSPAGVMYYKFTNAGESDYSQLPYWHGSTIQWDLSYGRDLQRFMLVTPFIIIGDKPYRDLSCLFNRSCEPVWEKQKPAPGVFIDSSAFFLRQQQTDAAFLQVADSLMRSRFTAAGLGNYFKRICFQKTCDERGQPLSGFYRSAQAGCKPEPDTLCTQALIRYQYFHNGQTVPLKLDVQVNCTHLLRYAIFLENNSVPPVAGISDLRQLNLLTLEQIKKKAAEQFTDRKFQFREEQLYNGEALSLVYAYFTVPVDSIKRETPSPGKFKHIPPKYTDMSAAGKLFRQGYIYSATLLNPGRNEGQLIFSFDAVTGNYLFTLQVTNELYDKKQ